jgi:SAM-dependent methyltransferase
MIHTDHIALLQGEPGVRDQLGLPLRARGGTWADLGCGAGAFTLALADLLGPGAVIYAIDRDRSALERLSVAMRKSFPLTRLTTLAADFTRALDLPVLDGVVMANSLHFLSYPAQREFLPRLRGCLRPAGQLLLVEYNSDQGNPWVPYPLSLSTWRTSASQAGYTQTTRLAAYPSRFMDEIISSVSIR